VPTAARPITGPAQCKIKSNFIMDKNNINSSIEGKKINEYN
jgi:hypothetical protein